MQDIAFLCADCRLFGIFLFLFPKETDGWDRLKETKQLGWLRKCELREACLCRERVPVPNCTRDGGASQRSWEWAWEWDRRVPDSRRGGSIRAGGRLYWRRNGLVE